MSTAKVIHIFTAPQAGAPMQNHQQIKATEGIGLEGDRYAANKGKWSEPEPQAKRQVTLIERENIDALLNEHGIEVDPALLRRNIVTQGVNLNDLVGITFQIGDVRLQGEELCEPCSYMESFSKQGVLKGLVNKGGLRAQILQGGKIHIDDSIVIQSK